MELEIIYQDNFFIAINKPNGLLVHRSPIAKDESVFALQLLRDQVGRKVYPIHRLDRKTSGVLIFAFDTDSLKTMQKQFAERLIKKSYLALVRGYTDDLGLIDYPLKSEKGSLQEAITEYKTLARTELHVPFGKHSTSRYSLVEVNPQTGRMHQIRKHFAHILHPIIGDRPHGCNKQNRLFKEKWNMTIMLLHAAKLNFEHPVSMKPITIAAKISPEFWRMSTMMKLKIPEDFC